MNTMPETKNNQILLDEVYQIFRTCMAPIPNQTKMLGAALDLLTIIKGTLTAEEKNQLASNLQMISQYSIETALFCFQVADRIGIDFALTDDQIWKIIMQDYNREVFNNLEQLLAHGKSREMPTAAIAAYLEGDPFGSEHLSQISTKFDITAACMREKEKLQPSAEKGMLSNPTLIRVQRLRALGFEVNLERLTAEETTSTLGLVRVAIDLNEKVAPQAFQKYMEYTVQPYSTEFHIADSKGPQDYGRKVEKKWQKILSYMRQHQYAPDMKPYINKLRKENIRHEVGDEKFTDTQRLLEEANLWTEPDYRGDVDDVCKMLRDFFLAEHKFIGHFDHMKKERERDKDLPFKEALPLAIQDVLSNNYTKDRPEIFYRSIDILEKHFATPVDLKLQYLTHLELTLFSHAVIHPWIITELEALLEPKEKAKIVNHFLEKAIETADENNARKVRRLAHRFGISEDEWYAMVRKKITTSPASSTQTPETIRTAVVLLTMNV